jgi:MFS family permease
VLIVTVGTTICFGLNSLSYLAVIAALLVIRPRKAGGPAPAGRRGVKEGLKYAAGRQQLWLPLLMMSVIGLLAFNFSVVLPVFAKDTFHGTGGTYGLLTSMLSVGAIVGSLAVGLVHHPRRQYLLFAALGFGVTSAATAVAPNVAVACVTLLVMGAAAFCFVTLCSTTLQLHSSSAFRGRIMALWVFVYLGTTPIGSIVTGWIISAGGPRVALLVGSGACLGAAVLAAFVRTPADPDQALTDLGR